MILVENGTQDQSVVVIWAPVGRDAALAADVLNRAEIHSRPCYSVEEVCTAIATGEAGIAILAEETLHTASIAMLRQTLDGQPPWSDLPLLLLTGGGNSTEASLSKLSRMRILGNITLLERPLRMVTLTTAVRSGLASRQRQMQARDYIRTMQSTQEKLAQANADLKQFAFAASHDLQEPLRMVNVFTQLLLERHVDPSDKRAQQFADFVRSGVHRMEELLRDLLSYSRAIHEERLAPTTPFPLDLALADAVAALQVELIASEAELLQAPLPLVRGDRTQLSLVFQNLVSNAIKYGKPDVRSRIEISADVNGAEALIRVSDNGIGFDQQYAERVFDLFQRLGDSDAPGTGLGLAICRRIIERHGGEIGVRPRAGGNVFWFRLPAD